LFQPTVVENREASHDRPKTGSELQAFVAAVTTTVNGGPAGTPLLADIAACVEVLARGEVEMWWAGGALRIAPRGGVEEILTHPDYVLTRSIFEPQAGLRGLHKREPHLEGVPLFAGGAKKDLLYISICAECPYSFGNRSPELIVAHVIDINGKLGSLFWGEPMLGAVWKLTLRRASYGKKKALPDPDDEFWAKAFSVEWWQEAVDDAYFHHWNADRIAPDFFAFCGELDSR